MKKSQRTRLAALVAKDQATLTAEEKSELASLQALALAHPDASKDVDDIAPVGFKAALVGALATLRDKGQLGAQNSQLATDLATRTTERDQARTDLATAQAQLAAICAFFGLTAAELKGKDAAACAALLTQKISDSAAEQVAALGVEPKNLPKQTAGNGGGAAETLEDIQAQMKDEKDPEKLGRLAARANSLREKVWGAGNN